jgi:Regulator of chromosome condensation (RCC1) repeat
LYALSSIGNGTAVAVEAGYKHVCILRADNTSATTNSSEVVCWGAGGDGQLVSFCVHFLRIPQHTFTTRKAPLFELTHVFLCVYLLTLLCCVDLTLYAYFADATNPLMQTGLWQYRGYW